MATRVAVAFWAVFFTMGVYLPFWPVWLHSRGLSPDLIGVALGLGAWARVGLNPVVGSLTDRTGHTRVVAVALALVVLASYAMFSISHGTVALLVLSLVLGCGFAPLVPIIDAVAVRSSATMDYGRVRRWGSVAFIVASVGVGRLLDQASEDAIVDTLIGASVLLVIAVLWLPQPARAPAASTPTSMRALLSRPDFRLFVLACAALHGSHSVLYAYGTPHWRSAGIDESTIGWLWALGVVAEIALFSVGPRLTDRLSPPALLAMAGLGGMLRWPLLALTTSVPWLALAQLLHGLTFGATHLGAMSFVRRHVDPEATTRATSLYAAVATGLAFGIGLPLAGVLYEALHGYAFAFMGAASAVGTVLALGLRRRLRQETTTVNSTAS